MTSLQRRGDGLMRVDVRGRVRTPLDRRQELLAEYDRSGLSAAQFARLTRISYQTFCGWLHRRRRRERGPDGAGTEAVAMKWIEDEAQLPVAASPAAAALLVELGAGAWLAAASAAQARLAAVVLLSELTHLQKGGASC